MNIEKGFTYIDLFCGIGGFHQAMENLGGECLYASDIDPDCRKTYERNYGIKPDGDITIFLDNVMIGKMQVKFNNGFLEQCKKLYPDVVEQGVRITFGKPFGSWNFSV